MPVFMLLLQLKQIYQRDHNMIDFYNAFISYRHAPLDSAIATHVQRKLEHFHVPHKLKKKLKREKITRIFRDKDELPITSDLSNTIEEALFNSDFLIVLCSTNTHLSTWVEREIKLFLQNQLQWNLRSQHSGLSTVRKIPFLLLRPSTPGLLPVQLFRLFPLPMLL